MSKELVTCESCGASFNEDEPKCPYCGTLNPVGAEKEYGEKLEGIREHLDKVDDFAKGSYLSLIKEGFKVFAVVFLISAVVFLVSYSSIIKKKYEKYASRREEVDKKIELMIHYKDNVAVINDLYEKKDYEAIVNFLESLDHNDEIELHKWEHYHFCEAYAHIVESKASVDKFKTAKERFYYDYGKALYEAEDFYISAFAGYYVNSYTDEDKAELENIWKEHYEYLCKELDIKSSELDMLIESAVNNRYAQYYECKDFAKEKVGEY